MNNVFSKASKIFYKKSAAEVSTKNVLPAVSNYDVLTKALDIGQIPKEQFFQRGESKEFSERLAFLGLDNSNINFADHLISEECKLLLRRNKMTTHTETENIFLDNKNSGRSIYDFFYAQQDYNKKLLKKKFIFIICIYKLYIIYIYNHNLSKQDLGKSNHEISLDSVRTTELVKSINSVLQSMIFRNKKKKSRD